jgi:radical SAM superfamily enzyme YgiQ (UPF0313 family)
VALIDALDGGKKRQVPLPRTFSYMREFIPGDRAPFALFSGYYRYGLEENELLDRIRLEQPRMVGISLLTTAYCEPALHLARRVRERLPEAVLFCGGHHPTRFPESCLEAFDYAVRGDGEEAAPRLARALLNGRGEVNEIQGVCRKNDAGTPRIVEPTFLRDDELDRIRPLRSLARTPVIHGRRFTQILTSRGCPLNCTYCCTTKRLSGGYRKRKVEEVLEEFLDTYHRDGVTHFDIEDENVTFDRKRAKSLFQGLVRIFQGKGVLLTAMNGLLPETLDDELVDLMHEAGFNKLDLSLGSTHPEILKRYGRPAGLMEPFREAVESARKHGMGVTAYVISGGPHVETKDVVHDLLCLAALPVRIGLSIYYPAPGSRDYENGLFSKPATFSLHRASVYPVEGDMDRLQMFTASRLARVLNYLKALPSRGTFTLRGVAPISEREVVRPEDEFRLAASFLHNGTLMGLSPHDRKAYAHRVDPSLAEAFRQGLLEAGKVAGFHGDLTL